MTPIDVFNKVAARGSAIGVDYINELELWGYKIVRARKPRKRPESQTVSCGYANCTYPDCPCDETAITSALGEK